MAVLPALFSQQPHEKFDAILDAVARRNARCADQFGCLGSRSACRLTLGQLPQRPPRVLAENPAGGAAGAGAA
jgi:hypothetical protein